MGDDHSSLISTEDLQTAAEYVDNIVGMIRDAHAHGAEVNVEELTTMMLMAIAASDRDEHATIAIQSLMLAVCMRRLA